MMHMMQQRLPLVEERTPQRKSRRKSPAMKTGNATVSSPNPATLGEWRLNAVHNIDARVGLQTIPSDSLDVVVTSPPYWGQRDSDGLGCEVDPRDYIRNLTEILAETMRCLSPSGTLWLNIGDSYNTPINWREDDYGYSSLGKEKNGLPRTNQAYTKKRGHRRAFIDRQVGWLQYGNLLAIPHRVVITLADMGYLFRGEVMWEKSRPLPEGLCRRPHRRHEAIYIIAKTERHSFRVRPPVGSVWKLVQTPNRLPHCSTFPLDLPIQCIKASAVQRKGVIFDPFMGSGTTGKAARMLGYDFLGFEINRKNCETANDWINSETQELLPITRT